MGRGPEESNNTLTRLLLEYLKDSNRSDKQIAKELGTSQATVSRLKHKLIKDGFVRHFSAIPNLDKLGYEILAISIVKFNTELVLQNLPKIEKMAKSWAKTRPEILFDARAEGMDVDVVNFSVHKNYAAYKDFLTETKRVWGNLLADVRFILIDLNGPLGKPFSFEYLAENSDEQ
ncbi:MAG: hypothetical protein CW716_09160 [Candidatus Bathyarchaeum sp.]|nr:MAG: hypothetical protein CW716_09160 [Candidatus Bathyarchaeum sp.]